MSAKRVTLADVARAAGVSVTTASFVLTGREGMRISEATEGRVRTASAALGYRPNMAARGLRSKQTMTLGLVADTIGSGPYAGQMLRGAINEAAKTSRVVMIAETADDDADRAELVAAMLDRRVDGIMYGTTYTHAVRPPKILTSVPHVFLNCLPAEQTAPSVIPDERPAGRTAAAALLDAGHRDGIYYLGGRQITELVPDGIYAGHERLAGITEELRSRDVPLAGSIECAWRPADGYNAARTLLAGGARPRALICANDRVAVGAYQAMAEFGLRVPDDVSVVSFDDSELAGWMRPGMSSVALPHRELGARAVQLLVDGDLAPAVYRVAMPLVRRDSIAPR
jgi:LacI family transcriptional regulator